MSLIVTTINHPDNPTGRGYQLSLPDKDSRLTDCLRRFELLDVSSARKTSTEKNCLMQNVNVLGKSFSILEGTLCNLDELNYLAKRLDSLRRAAARWFEACPAENFLNFGALFWPPQKLPTPMTSQSSSISHLTSTTGARHFCGNDRSLRSGAPHGRN